MHVAVIGARGAVGRTCVEELEAQRCHPIALQRGEEIPSEAQGVLVAAETSPFNFSGTVVDCSHSLEGTALALPNIHLPNTNRVHVPNCMASIIMQALHELHETSTIVSLVATCMQSASGAGWKGVQALETGKTQDVFHGELVHNVLPHENAAVEEKTIASDIQSLFQCAVTATSFRVPVRIGHMASLRVVTKHTIDPDTIKEQGTIDPLSSQGERTVAVGRVRVQKNTADLVVCGDQLLCGAAIPAVQLLLVL